MTWMRAVGMVRSVKDHLKTLQATDPCMTDPWEFLSMFIPLLYLERVLYNPRWVFVISIHVYPIIWDENIFMDPSMDITPQNNLIRDASPLTAPVIPGMQSLGC